mmetsp:Transcript_43172/g.94124  ORF Transcript_43172/g.94124 Transcript_43172/m.94124 type:complete len:810 (-) Transcript_43172:148-2577(-)
MDEIPASEFSGRDFAARELLQRYRKRVPLPQLRKCLQAHHEATHQELVELINEKYADFVSLSSRMQGVERALRPLRAPLEESSEVTKGVHSRLGALLSQAEEAHKSLADLGTRKEALKAYIENAQLLDKAKATAANRWANPQESEDFLREHIAQENVARDLRRLRLNLGGALRSRVSQPASVAAPAPSAVEASEASASPGAPEVAPTDERPDPVATSPECKALLEEAVEFEEALACQVSARLRGLLAASKLCLEGGAEGSAEGNAQSTEARTPPRSELLAIAHLCRALVTLGRSEALEEIFTEVFVQGALEGAATACAAAAEGQRRGTGAEAGGAGGLTICVSAGAVDLKPFFDAVLASLLTEGAPLLWFARCLSWKSDSSADVEDHPEGSLLMVPSLHIISNAAAGPVLVYLQKTWPNVFMPAFPDVFASNYAHTAAFIRNIEALMSPVEQRVFARSAAYVDIKRRWKTQVYASLRAKEANQRLEATAGVAAEQTEGKRLALGHQFFLGASAEVIQTLELVWSDRWYLDVLYQKTVQLSLELLAKYGRILTGLAQGADAPGSGWNTTSVPPTWSASSLPARLSRAAADALQVLAELEVEGGIARLALKRAPGGPGGRPAELARLLFGEAAAALRPGLEVLEAAMIRHVTAAAAPQFTAIRGIPAVYRMLNKPVPTKASPYVDSALRPVQALHEVAAAVATSVAATRWARQAVDAAAKDFAGHAAQLLESTHQQEASLRRLAGRGAGGESQVSDLDKIHIQLCLDVEAFTAAAASLGTTPVEDCPGLSKLAQTVTPVRHTYEAHRPANT